jgi:hypothetical protein
MASLVLVPPHATWYGPKCRVREYGLLVGLKRDPAPREILRGDDRRAAAGEEIDHGAVFRRRDADEVLGGRHFCHGCVSFARLVSTVSAGGILLDKPSNGLNSAIMPYGLERASGPPSWISAPIQ